MSEPENGEHPDVLQPHTRKDLFRVGWVILLCFLPVAGIGYRFFHQHQDAASGSQNLAAAVMFWFISLMLLSVGAGILLRLRRTPDRDSND